MSINYEGLRVTKLKKYMFDLVKTINEGIKEINVSVLSTDIDCYSLEKIPTSSEVTKWVNGEEIHRDVYTFSSRVNYSLDVIENLQNIGFFEMLETSIKENNRKGTLPEITGIQSIECLNCGALSISEDATAIFDIQIQITYKIGG